MPIEAYMMLMFGFGVPTEFTAMFGGLFKTEPALVWQKVVKQILTEGGDLFFNSLVLSFIFSDFFGVMIFTWMLYIAIINTSG